MNKNKNKIEKEESLKKLRQSGRGPKIKIKNSIFIASAYEINDIKLRTSILDRNKIELKKATHYAWALRIESQNGVWEESSDDGEVSGCAGKPILFILQQLKIINALVIVTRYYGGIHLGPAGLIKAYSATAKNLLESIGFDHFNS